MASDPTIILAEKLRTLEARVAMAEDDIRILHRRQGWGGLSMAERQALSAAFVIVVLLIMVKRASHV